MGGGLLSLGSRPTSCLCATGVQILYDMPSTHNMPDTLIQALVRVNLLEADPS